MDKVSAKKTGKAVVRGPRVTTNEFIPTLPSLPSTPDVEALRAGPVLRHDRFSQPDITTPEEQTVKPPGALIAGFTIVSCMIIGSAASSAAAIATFVTQKDLGRAPDGHIKVWMGISLALVAISSIVMYLVIRGVWQYSERRRHSTEGWFELQHRHIKDLPERPSTVETTRSVANRSTATSIDGRASSRGTGTTDSRTKFPDLGSFIRLQSTHAEGSRSASAPAVSEGTYLTSIVEAQQEPRLYQMPRGRTVSHTRNVPSGDFFNGQLAEWNDRQDRTGEPVA